MLRLDTVNRRALACPSRPLKTGSSPFECWSFHTRTPFANARVPCWPLVDVSPCPRTVRPPLPLAGTCTPRRDTLSNQTTDVPSVTIRPSEPVVGGPATSQGWHLPDAQVPGAQEWPH